MADIKLRAGAWIAPKGGSGRPKTPNPYLDAIAFSVANPPADGTGHVFDYKCETKTAADRSKELNRLRDKMRTAGHEQETPVTVLVQMTEPDKGGNVVVTYRVTKKVSRPGSGKKAAAPAAKTAAK